MTARDEHVHEFIPELVHVEVQDRREPYHYTGEAMALILKTCSCGEKIGMDYGKYKDVKVRFDKLGAKK